MDGRRTNKLPCRSGWTPATVKTKRTTFTPGLSQKAPKLGSSTQQPTTTIRKSCGYRQATNRSEPQSLLVDPVLNETLSAGLAGPPPQLDWLFADHPMERLFDENHEITFGQPRDLGLTCQTVLVNADGDHYRFWIDPRASLIHRVELPPVQLPDDSARSVGLTLELIGATFDTANEPPPIEDLPEQPPFVGRFVPLPPVEPAQALGRTLEPFRLSDRTGQIKIDLPSSDRKVTVILFVTADKRSIWNAVAFNQWTSMMTADVASRVRSIVVTDQDAKTNFQRICRSQSRSTPSKRLGVRSPTPIAGRSASWS